jgi:hypothetical protein
MRWRRLGWIPLLVLPAVAFWLAPKSADSLPLFARRNGVACTTCHFAFPRLNAFGMAFRQNGYRMPGAKGENPWEAKEFPLSVVGNVGYVYESTDESDGQGGRVTTAVGGFTQNQFEFHSAGTLAPEVTFHFDNDFDGAGGTLNGGMAFVQFDDIAKDGALNIKAGIYDAEIPYLADSRKTTNTGYLSPVTLDGEGVELNGTRSGWTYAAGLVNSGRTLGKPTDKTLNNLENPYGWLMRDFDGQLVCGRIALDSQDPRDSTKSRALHTQAELSAYLNRARWIVIPGVTYESYADPNDTQRDKVITGLLEGLVFLDPDSRWLFTGRYELRHMPKFDWQGSTVFPEEDDARVTANVSYLANPNARIGFELSHDSDNVQGPRVTTFQAYVHVGY